MGEKSKIIRFPKSPPRGSNHTVIENFKHCVAVGVDKNGDIQVVSDGELSVAQVNWLMDQGKAYLLRRYGK